MKYRATHLKTGQVSILEAEKVRQIQENGFGGLFTFEAMPDKNEGKAGVWPEQVQETAESEEENEAEKPTKAKKTPK